jgi:hypothetical protein
MLKVNTAKISVEDFAKKYNLIKQKWNDKEFFYRLNYPFFENFPVQFAVFENGLVVFLKEPYNKELDILFDMIKNGDVTKE